MIKTCVLVTPGNFVKSKAGLAILRGRYDILLPENLNVPKEERQRVVAIVLADQPITSLDMDIFPNLKTIARTGTGYDNVDLKAAGERGIVVTRVSALNAPAVSEYALALIFALARNVVSTHEQLVHEKKWERSQGYMLADLTIGIVGVGTVGRALARKLQALGVKKLLGYDRPEVEEELRKNGEFKIDFPGDLKKLARESDVIVAAVELNDQTRGIISREILFLMKPTAFLVNVARGALVDEEALAEAIEAGRIGGAALDVYSTEPPLDQPFFQKLAKLQGKHNIILTPHMATTVKNLFEEISAKVAQNVIAVLDGKLEGLEIVN